MLFCSLMGSLVPEIPVFLAIGVSIAGNLAIFSFAQIYKHISNAPEDAFSPSKSDPNPISAGLVSLRAARIGVYLSLSLAVIASFLLNRLNIVLTMVSVVLTLALFHPNIRFSNRLFLGFNQRHFLYGGIFFLNSIIATQARPNTVEILFPMLFVVSYYLLIRVEEIRVAHPQHPTTGFWRIIFGASLLVSALLTFFLLRPLPFWVIALWAFLAAVQLSVSHSSQHEPNTLQPLYLLKVFEVSGVISFLVYLILIFIKPY